MRRLTILLCSALLCAQAQSPSSKKPYTPDIPKVWDDAAMASIELPRAAKVDVRPLSSAYYYTIPERTLWKPIPSTLPARSPRATTSGCNSRIRSRPSTSTN
ncbi:hypothetical protein HDF16_004515 [Granulicella aggregans]|uniref:Uncharacterized protein n=1 Tax=Granulicella aggregans TaxID=474949 RepID=A0A7W7ZIE1_9BACT|nr:hypothetical protein [Granulicella aggregans]MBB5059786.1 hypothetical protein [Granulicella aggregans]